MSESYEPRIVSPEKCPACGFRLDVDHCPCDLCHTGWAMQSMSREGPISKSCHDTCVQLKEWQERQRKRAEEVS